MARGKYKGPKRGAGQRARGMGTTATQEQEDAFRAEAGATTQLPT